MTLTELIAELVALRLEHGEIEDVDVFRYAGEQKGPMYVGAVTSVHLHDWTEQQELPAVGLVIGPIVP
jgi:hypothetical protein